MYIKLQASEDQKNPSTRNNFKMEEDVSGNSVINKIPSQDVIFKPFKNDSIQPISRSKQSKHTHSQSVTSHDHNDDRRNGSPNLHRTSQDPDFNNKGRKLRPASKNNRESKDLRESKSNNRTNREVSSSLEEIDINSAV